MNTIRSLSFVTAMAMLSGCASTSSLDGPKGPKIVSSGQSTQAGQYAEVGIQFSSWGDFVALVAPTRWRSPIATGGSLSWLNPVAWSDDAGRTGRILVGEVAVVGGVAIAAASGGSSGSSSGTTFGSGSSTPPPPTGGGGVTPPSPPG